MSDWSEVEAKIEAIKGQLEALEMFLSPFFNAGQGSGGGIPAGASAAATVLADTAFVSFTNYDSTIDDLTLIAQWAFAEDQTLGGRAGGAWSYTRSGAMWEIDQNGIMQSVGANTPFFHPTKGLSDWQFQFGRALHNRDLTNAVWSADGVTAQRNAVGLDAVSSAASTITATTAGGAISQELTLGSDDFHFNPYIKAGTVTGAVYISVDGGATQSDVSGLINTETFTRVFINQTLANPEPHIELANSGDSIIVDVAGVEADLDTPPIITGAAAVARQSATISIGPVTEFTEAQGTIYVRYQRPKQVPGTQVYFRLTDATNQNQLQLYTQSASPISLYKTNGSNQCVLLGLTTEADDTIYERAFAYNTNDFQHYQNGEQGSSDTTGTTASAGAWSSAVIDVANGYIAEIKAWRTRKSNIDLDSETT